MVDAGIRHYEAEAVLDDDQVRAVAHDAAGFRQDYLDEARVLAGLGGERDGALGRRHGGDLDDATFGFRDDLLRHDEHVAILGPELRGGKGGKRDRREIVARLHHRHAGRPVIVSCAVRIPL